MREARFRGQTRHSFAELNEADQDQVRDLVRYLERDPDPDGKYKVPIKPGDVEQYLIAFDDGVWRIVYHLSAEDALIIYGITKRRAS